MARYDDMCFKEDGIFGRGMRRDRLETVLGSKKKPHFHAMSYTHVVEEKIALLGSTSVRAMSSGNEQVRF